MLLNVVKLNNNKNSDPHSPGVARDFLFFSFLSSSLFILLNSIHSSSSSKLAFLTDARELIARELRQTCAARSGRARSHGLVNLVNKAVTVVRRLP